MYGVIIALLPALLVSFYFFGIGSAIVCATSVAACVLFEWAINKFMLKNERCTVCDGSAILTGLLLGFNLPSNLDWWLWRQIGLENDVYCVHEPLTKWRLHRSSYTCRDDNAGKTADGYDLISAMDRLLVRAHPVQAESLRAESSENVP